MANTYSRREWLQTLFTVGAFAILPAEARRWTAAAAPEQAFRIGYQLLSWGRYYPKDWWAGCQALGELGFAGVEGEYTITENYEGRWEEFRRQMAKYGVQLAALYSTSDLQKTDQVYQNLTNNLQAAAFLQAMGARVLVIGGSEASPPTDDDFKRMADTANELGRRALEEYGIKVGFHPHLGSMIQHREDIGRLMELTDPRYFFLAPDTGHLLAGGSDPVEVYRTYGSRIVHMHFKDFDPNAEGWRGRRGRFVALGEGSVDFAALVQILRGLDYDGWIVVEFDSRDAPRETAAANRAYLTEKLKLKL
jgi:inosose dehydratase